MCASGARDMPRGCIAVLSEHGSMGHPWLKHRCAMEKPCWCRSRGSCAGRLIAWRTSPDRVGKRCPLQRLVGNIHGAFGLHKRELWQAGLGRERGAKVRACPLGREADELQLSPGCVPSMKSTHVATGFARHAKQKKGKGQSTCS